MKIKTLTFLAGIVLLSLFCSNVLADRDLRICVKWEMPYEDIDDGEDFLTTGSADLVKDGTPYVVVPHAIFTIHDKEGKQIKSGRLGSTGCFTRELIPESGPYKKYFVRIWYGVEDDSGRAFNVLHGTTDNWSSKPQVYTERLVILHADDEVTDYEIYVTSTQYSRVVPAISNMIERSSELAWPEDTRIVFAVNNSNLCDKKKGCYHKGGDNFSNKQRICMQGKSNGEYEASKTNYYKITLGHEAGHALAAMNGGPLFGDYEGDARGGARYNIEKSECHNSTGKGHKYNTREWIGTAAKEGYAHFISAANLNDRDPFDGWYPDNGKKRYDSSNKRIKNGMSLVANASGEWEGYTNSKCKPPSEYNNLGSEIDWIRFFWGLWTMGGDSRFEISEINDVWFNTLTLKYIVPGPTVAAYCVPRTTLDPAWITVPAEGYERGWTCKDENWLWTSSSIGDSISVLEALLSNNSDHILSAKRNNRGEDYEALYKTVENEFGTLKAEFFNEIALGAKVIY